jgi:putative tryptophan/tyrosine transport system substrate-binding protein
MPYEIMTRRRLLQALLLVFVGRSDAAPADTEIRVFSSGDSDALRQVLQALERRFPKTSIYSAADALSGHKGPSLNLAVGPAALKIALDARPDGPLIALFTSSQTYRQLVGAQRTASGGGPVTAIYAEASPHHQMQLIARLYGRQVSVGVLLSEGTAYLIQAIQDAARQAGLEVVIERTSIEVGFNEALLRLKGTRVVLLVPDSNLYTPESIRNLLESTYRRNQAVIGFSVSLVNAGALAAAYSSTEDVVGQLEEILVQAAVGRLPDAQYPRYWRIAVNDSVARSLNITVDEAVRLLGQRP